MYIIEIHLSNLFRDLMEMTEGLTNDLAAARNEILRLRREFENCQYLHENVRGAQSDGDSGIFSSPRTIKKSPPIHQTAR